MNDAESSLLTTIAERVTNLGAREDEHHALVLKRIDEHHALVLKRIDEHHTDFLTRLAAVAAHQTTNHAEALDATRKVAAELEKHQADDRTIQEAQAGQLEKLRIVVANWKGRAAGLLLAASAIGALAGLAVEWLRK